MPYIRTVNPWLAAADTSNNLGAIYAQALQQKAALAQRDREFMQQSMMEQQRLGLQREQLGQTGEYQKSMLDQHIADRAARATQQAEANKRADAQLEMLKELNKSRGMYYTAQAAAEGAPKPLAPLTPTAGNELGSSVPTMLNQGKYQVPADENNHRPVLLPGQSLLQRDAQFGQAVANQSLPVGTALALRQSIFNPQVVPETTNQVSTIGKWNPFVENKQVTNQVPSGRFMLEAGAIPPETLRSMGSAATNFMQNVPAAQQSVQTKSGPAPGTVMKGYRFLGGDPADKNNWEKVP